MNILFDKLSSEIRIFTFIQFIGAMIGSISSLYFFTVQTPESPKGYVAARFASILTLLIIGLCDFFIHRNAEFLRSEHWANSLDEKYSVQFYENCKSRHFTTKFVVPVVMMIFGVVLSYVLFASSASPFEISPINLFFVGLWLISFALFLAGAELGKRGWRLE